MALVDIGKGKLATSPSLDSARALSVARFLLSPVVAAFTSEGIQIRLQLHRLFHEMPSRKEMLRRRWVFAAPLAAESAGRRLDAGRRHIESPGENQSDRKADEQQDDGQALSPAAIT